jgi:hypothetical protein
VLCAGCRVKAVKRRHVAELRQQMFGHYGTVCACCGESDIRFLTIDHIHNDGAKHRKQFNTGGGYMFYARMIKNGFPEGLQTLCWNCNCAKHIYGECPHISYKILKEA